MNKENNFIPYKKTELSSEDLVKNSEKYYKEINKRRSVRDFSDKDIPKKVIENILKTAGSAPSGANKQPWTFCVISDKKLKSKIRELAEKEEYKNYHGRMSESWKEDLKAMGTTHIKEFLEIAPYIIVVFKKVYDLDEGITSSNNTNKEEALSALEVLGINKRSSERLVGKIVLENPDISVESIIKETLKNL